MATSPLLAPAKKERVSALDGLDSYTQSTLGQLFSPVLAANLNASIPSLPDSSWIRALGPGAGSGVLPAGLLNRILTERDQLGAEDAAIERDPKIMEIVHGPSMVRMQEVIDTIDKLFEGVDFRPSAVDNLVQGVVTILVDQEGIRQQAHANTREQFRESRDLERAVENAAVSHQEDQSKIMDYFLSSAANRRQIIRRISSLVYYQTNDAQDDTATDGYANDDPVTGSRSDDGESEND